jgi:hypothetical protein
MLLKTHHNFSRGTNSTCNGMLVKKRQDGREIVIFPESLLYPPPNPEAGEKLRAGPQNCCFLGWNRWAGFGGEWQRPWSYVMSEYEEEKKSGRSQNFV